jgi:hypothetical protein
VGNKIADKICKMREEGVQFTRDNLINIPYLAHSPELFEMIDYTTMVSDFTDLDPFLVNCTPSSLILQILSAILLPTPGSLNNSHLLQVFIFTFGILSIIKSKQCISNNKILRGTTKLVVNLYASLINYELNWCKLFNFYKVWKPVESF